MKTREEVIKSLSKIEVELSNLLDDKNNMGEPWYSKCLYIKADVTKLLGKTIREED